MISKECSIKLCICNQLTIVLRFDVKFGKIGEFFKILCIIKKCEKMAYQLGKHKSLIFTCFFF